MDINIVYQSIVEKMESFETTILSMERALIELNHRQRESEDTEDKEATLIQHLDSLENNTGQLSISLKNACKVFDNSTIIANKLEEHKKLMENPPTRRYKLLHRLGWSWIMGIVGMLIIGLLAGLLVVDHNRLGKYVANDTKYRYLKIQSTGKFRQYLYNLDSLYLSDPSLRTKVVKAEQQRNEKLQLSQKIQNQQQNLKQLKKEKRQKKDYLKPLN